MNQYGKSPVLSVLAGEEVMIRTYKITFSINWANSLFTGTFSWYIDLVFWTETKNTNGNQEVVRFISQKRSCLLSARRDERPTWGARNTGFVS